MKIFLPFALNFTFLILLTSCVASSKPIVLYDQSKFSKDQIVTLLPASSQGIYMVLEVDGKTAGGSCLTNCMFIKPVHVSPGSHKFSTWNMQIPGYTGLNSTVVFNFEAELEPGKTYKLQVNPIDNNKGQEQKFEISWHEETLP